MFSKEESGVVLVLAQDYKARFQVKVLFPTVTPDVPICKMKMKETTLMWTSKPEENTDRPEWGIWP